MRRVSRRSGTPPIAFTPGSAMWRRSAFFHGVGQAPPIGSAAARLLLSRHRDHIPQKLPPGVVYVDYAPFSELLPRCAAWFITAASAPAPRPLPRESPARMPRAHDQPDNARKLERLGVARSIRPGDYRASRVADALQFVLGEGAVAASRSVAARFAGVDPIGQTCELLESLSVV